MKRIVKRSLSLILVFVFLLSTIFSAIVYADESEEVNCLDDHFSNLKYTDHQFLLPVNIANSCPYVAMSMLLTYYDTYWDDDFVYEEFEWDEGQFDSSSKILSKTFSAASEFSEYIYWNNLHTDGTFNDFQLAFQYDYLDLHLISIGKILGYHNNSNDNFALNGDRIVNVLERYLYDTRGFEEEQVKVKILRAGDLGVGQKKLNETVIQQIEKGFPVIYCGISVDDPNIEFGTDINDLVKGHAMIAYMSSDEDNDGIRETIHLHNGLNNGDDSVVFSTVDTTQYQYWNLAIWLEIDEELLPHNCSYNYYDTHSGSNVCACNVYYQTHNSHTHFYHDEYSVLKHFGECICGNVVSEETHNFKYSSITSTTHHEKCRGCNYEITVNHYYDTFTILEDGHRGVCACGASIIEAHSESEYVMSTTLKHFVYCDCGYFYGPESHHMTTVGSRSVCVDCGYVGSSGITPPYEDSIFKLEENETTE